MRGDDLFDSGLHRTFDYALAGGLYAFCRIRQPRPLFSQLQVRTMTRAQLCAVLMLSAVLASCTAQPATETAKPQEGVMTVTSPPMTYTPPNEQIDEPKLPLSAYKATDEERALVDRGYVTLHNHCMQTRGFPARSVVPENTAKPIPTVWRYGVSDPAIAAQYGYHTPPGFRNRGNAERAEAERRYVENPMSDTELRANNECADNAQRQLGKPKGGSHMDDVLAQTLAVASFEQSRAHSHVREATGRWADCMHDKGYAVKDPLTVVDQFDLTTRFPTPAEVATATADVECKRESNLVRVWYTVEVATQSSLIRHNIDQLQAGRDSVDTAVHIAAQTLGAATPR